MDSTPESTPILYECKNRIAYITLNRPEKLNAFDDNMARELIKAFSRFDMDDDAHTAIVSGNGRAFCSGADVRARQMKSRDELTKGGRAIREGVQVSDVYIRAVNWKPVITAVQGYAVGMGTGLAFGADLVVAEEGCKFQITETPRGLSGGAKLMAMMRYRGGGSFATEVSLTGRFFNAQEALAANIIDRVAPPGQALKVAEELATAINQNPPLAVRANVMIRRWELEEIQRESLRMSSLNKLYLTEDFAEAARAFVEKRKPKPFNAR